MRKAVCFPFLRPLGAPVLLLMGVLLWSACDRPFVETAPPTVTILEPDFSTAFVNANTTIRVRAESFRDVEEVRLNGVPLTFQPGSNTWETSIELLRGLNTLLIQATDIGGVSGTDTVFALHLPFQFSIGPTLPSPRGGHTTTLLSNGALLVTGGIGGGNLQTSALLLPPGSNTFTTLPQGLNEPRTGHTATMLPDGRVLILGGSRTDNIRTVSDLVETVEVYDPITRTFSVVPVDGEPIRRALHTAVLRSSTLVDLYGGRGDIRYGSDPRLGVRSDLRTFRFTGERLEALNNVNSAPSIESIAGHTQTPIRDISPGQPGNYLIVGSFFNEQGADDISFRLDFSQPPGIFIDDVPRLEPSRTRHAGVLLNDGFVAYFGGTQDTPSDALDETAVYVENAGRFFRLPRTGTPLKRFGHTATKLSSQRILLLGGFTASGNSIDASEFFDSFLPN